MVHSDFILRARAVANEAEAKGFKHTAEAMRQTVNDLLATNSDIYAAPPGGEEKESQNLP